MEIMSSSLIYCVIAVLVVYTIPMYVYNPTILPYTLWERNRRDVIVIVPASYVHDICIRLLSDTWSHLSTSHSDPGFSYRSQVILILVDWHRCRVSRFPPFIYLSTIWLMIASHWFMTHLVIQISLTIYSSIVTLTPFLCIAICVSIDCPNSNHHKSLNLYGSLKSCIPLFFSFCISSFVCNRTFLLLFTLIYSFSIKHHSFSIEH